MVARVAPEIRQRQGSLWGKVIRVSSSPVERDDALRVRGKANLPGASGLAGELIEVEIELGPGDAGDGIRRAVAGSVPRGFRAFVVVEQRAPLDSLLPFLRRTPWGFYPEIP
jgi:hypothetical protein